VIAPGIVLRADAVTKRYGEVKALDGVSIAVRRGHCVALIGESGSGKTTLLRCFNGMVVPDEGEVSVEGTRVGAKGAIALRRRIGYVPQDGGLMPHWRILRNVELVPRLRREKEAPSLARDALRLVGLDPARFEDRWPGELSGGQRQRAAIARALAARPDVILLDEPFGALDAITRSDLQQAFQELHRQLGFTAVLVTHDLREALLLADEITVMRDGCIEQAATPDELVEYPATPYVAKLLRRAQVARGDLVR
jgi:osmoprotectant transport system ATP-binding protein